MTNPPPKDDAAAAGGAQSAKSNAVPPDRSDAAANAPPHEAAPAGSSAHSPAPAPQYHTDSNPPAYAPNDYPAPPIFPYLPTHSSSLSQPPPPPPPPPAQPGASPPLHPVGPPPPLAKSASVPGPDVYTPPSLTSIPYPPKPAAPHSGSTVPNQSSETSAYPQQPRPPVPDPYPTATPPQYDSAPPTEATHSQPQQPPQSYSAPAPQYAALPLPPPPPKPYFTTPPQYIAPPSQRPPDPKPYSATTPQYIAPPSQRPPDPKPYSLPPLPYQVPLSQRPPSPLPYISPPLPKPPPHSSYVPPPVIQAPPPGSYPDPIPLDPQPLPYASPPGSLPPPAPLDLQPAPYAAPSAQYPPQHLSAPGQQPHLTKHSANAYSYGPVLDTELPEWQYEPLADAPAPTISVDPPSLAKVDNSLTISLCDKVWVESVHYTVAGDIITINSKDFREIAALCLQAAILVSNHNGQSKQTDGSPHCKAYTRVGSRSAFDAFLVIGSSNRINWCATLSEGSVQSQSVGWGLPALASCSRCAEIGSDRTDMVSIFRHFPDSRSRYVLPPVSDPYDVTITADSISEWLSVHLKAPVVGSYTNCTKGMRSKLYNRASSISIYVPNRLGILCRSLRINLRPSGSGYQAPGTGVLEGGKHEAMPLVTVRGSATALGLAITIVLTVLVSVFNPGRRDNWFERLQDAVFTGVSMGLSFIALARAKVSQNCIPKLSLIRSQALMESVARFNGMTTSQLAVILAATNGLDGNCYGKHAGLVASNNDHDLAGTRAILLNRPVKYSDELKQVWVFGHTMAYNVVTGVVCSYIVAPGNIILIGGRIKADVLYFKCGRRLKGDYRIG